MKGRISRITVMLMVAVMVFMQTTAFAAFAPTFSEVTATNSGRSDNSRPITNIDWLNMQGVAFDTYTGKDGYSFNQNTKGKSDYQLVHFTLDGSAVTKGKSVVYKKKNVGHANDATIFQYKNKKYMLVAVSGGTELSSKTSKNKTTKIAVIRMSDYNKGKAKVYGCKIKVKKGVEMQSRPIKKANITGITYVGMKKVDKKKRPVFVFRDGLQLYAAYATVSKKEEITLTVFDRAKINKPTIKYNGKKYEPAAQGVTYHNKYLYIPFSGEKSKDTLQEMMIGRITYSKLFKGKPTSKAKNLETFSKRYDSYKVDDATALVTKKVKKHIAESIFFTKLEGKSEMFITVNRANTDDKASDVDYILVSNQTL